MVKPKRSRCLKQIFRVPLVPLVDLVVPRHAITVTQLWFGPQISSPQFHTTVNWEADVGD